MQKRHKKRRLPLALAVLARGLLLLPIFAAMAYVNYTVDASGVFHGAQGAEEISSLLLSGHPVDNYDSMDERRVIAAVAENAQGGFDTIALGSSRVLMINEDIADGGSFFNAGVSGGNFVDAVGLYYVFEKAGKKPNTVIISPDHWWLSTKYYGAHERSDKNLYGEFLSLNLGRPTSYLPDANERFRLDALFSPAYLQGNLSAFFEGGSAYTQPSAVVGELMHQSTSVKMPDGSVLYNESYRNMSASEREPFVVNHATNILFSDGFLQLDEQLCAIFDEYIQYLLSQDIQVIFVMSPYHPSVYANLLEHPEQYSAIFESERFYTQYALQHGIPFYGSYNPLIVGISEKGFYDGFHMRGEYWDEIFPGVAAVTQQMQDGEAYSPWLLEGVLISEEVAQTAVQERYEITAEDEILRREADEEIFGESAYVFGRYQVMQNSMVQLQLARYAVTQEEGIIYRYDTLLSEWVVDH